MKRLRGNLSLFAVVLCALVVVLGAYTRLADAGLGCPDWPGCYGHAIAPLDAAAIAAANQAHPWRPFEMSKAIKEMTHRYFAGGLIATVALLTVLAWRDRRRGYNGENPVPLNLALFVFGLIALQALLGMWTVTWKLKPIVVTAHLLGGFAVLALLWLMTLQTGRARTTVAAAFAGRNQEGKRKIMRGLRAAAVVGLALLTAQIALGGWVSANYAALVCGADFPTCQSRWWPDMDWREGFTLWRGIGQNYEFGILAADARAAIHVAHRIGALVVFCYLSALCVFIIKSSPDRALKRIAAAVIAVLSCQVLLGVANVMLLLPLAVATAHNAVGAALLLSMVTMLYALRRSDSPPVRTEG